MNNDLDYLTPEEKKSYACAPLLPEPGEDVVKQHLKTIGALRKEVKRLEAKLKYVTRHYKGVAL